MKKTSLTLFLLFGICLLSASAAHSQERYYVDKYWSQVTGETVVRKEESGGIPQPPSAGDINSSSSSGYQYYQPQAPPPPPNLPKPLTEAEEQAMLKKMDADNAAYEREQRREAERTKPAPRVHGKYVTITLKNGSTISTDSYWKEGNMFAYEQFGAVMKVSEDSVASIQEK